MAFQNSTYSGKDLSNTADIVEFYPHGISSESNAIDEKQYKKLKRYSAQGSISDYGQFLLNLAFYMDGWYKWPTINGSEEKEVGASIVEYFGRNKPERIESEIDYLISALSQGGDLIEKSVYKQLNNGIPINSITLPINRFSGPVSTEVKGSYFFLWAPLSLNHLSGLGRLGYIPNHERISQNLTKAMNYPNLTIYISSVIRDNSSFDLRKNQSWVTRSRRAIANLVKLTELIKYKESDKAKKYWFVKDDNQNQKYWALICISTDNLSVNINTLMTETSEALINAFQSLLDAELSKAGFSPCITVGKELHRFSAPNEYFDKRLQLLLS